MTENIGQLQKPEKKNAETNNGCISGIFSYHY